MNCDKTIVVIGGGIAGISCIEALFHGYSPTNPQYSCVVLISESRLIKKIINYEAFGRNLERFDVSEEEIDQLNTNIPLGLQFKSIFGSVVAIDSREKLVFYNAKEVRADFGPSTSTFKLGYFKLCICVGSKPKQLNYSKLGQCPEVDDRIIVIRDSDTVNNLRIKLAKCKRLAIVGNGGIGLELITKVTNCEKVWIIRDESIGLTFFDSGAAKFLLDSGTHDSKITTVPSGARPFYTLHNDGSTTLSTHGPSLGPNWSQNLQLSGDFLLSQRLEIIYNDEVEDVTFTNNCESPLKIATKSGKSIDCDLIVSAIGVEPNLLSFVGPNIETTSDNGILIDDQMRTSLEHLYAAGDVVSCKRWPTNNLWFQMRLWTQARQMGYYAGRCIVEHINLGDPSIYFNFDCFAHCTSFFGYKLVLLGNYNGQFLEKIQTFEVIARVKPNKDYVKLLVGDDGRVIGSVIVGDSGLEETIENLIHDRIDVSAFKEQLLDESVDIEDYFD